MRDGKTSLLSASLIFFIINGSAYAYYEVIDLGPGIAYSINDNGQIVGVSGDHAVLFDSTGQGNNIDLGTLDGYPDSRALSINNNGQIIGVANYENSPVPNGRAVLFDSTGGGANINLGTLPAAPFPVVSPWSAASSINDNGQIVGYSNDILNRTRATVFDPMGNGDNLDLGGINSVPYSPDGSMAFSINDNGRIVGASIYYERPGTQYYHAVFFDETDGGENIDLGSLGGNESWARFINNNNQIVGYASFEPVLPGDFESFHAALFDSSGSGNNTDLGTLGGEESWAFAINDFGQIIGSSEIPGSMLPHAVLFDPTGQGNNIDLNTLISPSSGWELRYAHSINNSGWIVGYGIHNGQDRAFLLTPEPATVLLLGLGCLTILRKRRSSHRIGEEI